MQLQKVKLNNPFVAHTLNAQNTEPLNQRNYNLSAVTKKEKKKENLCKMIKSTDRQWQKLNLIHIDCILLINLYLIICLNSLAYMDDNFMQAGNPYCPPPVPAQ